MLISRYKKGCTLPFEIGATKDYKPGEITVRKATPEELAELEKRFGPVCNPILASQIRAKYRMLHGLKNTERHPWKEYEKIKKNNET